MMAYKIFIFILYVCVCVSLELPMCNSDISKLWYLPQEAGVNQDYQFYNNDTTPNAFCENSKLIIEVRPTPWSPGKPMYSYSSSMLISKTTFGYGTLKIRAQIPRAKGLWPAIWLLPYQAMRKKGMCAYPDERGCVWPTQGEIDIMETVNDAESMPAFMQTIHFGLPGTPGYPMDPDNQIKYPVPTDAQWWDQPHDYELERTPTTMSMLVDGVTTFQVNDSFIQSFLDDEVWGPRRPSSYQHKPMAPFDESNPYNLILNIAVGGTWPCNLYDCNCCPGDRRWPLHNTTINDPPYPRMIIHSIKFDSFDRGTTVSTNVLWIVSAGVCSIILVILVIIAIVRQSYVNYEETSPIITQKPNHGSVNIP